MHVFTESVGIPLRRYLLRLRVQRAAGALAAGHTVTEAAHAAGFADAPHLTRTFRRILGATPRDLLRRAPDAQGLLVLVTMICAFSPSMTSQDPADTAVRPVTSESPAIGTPHRQALSRGFGHVG
jgi:AraC-like DNA-binding protein